MRGPADRQPDEPGWWLASDGKWYPPERPPGRWPLSRTWIAAVCELLLVVFFVATLHSVSTEDIDGLNYLPNVLFGMPWNLAVAPVTWILGVERNVYVRAAIDFVAASFNVLLLWWLLGRSARRSVAP